MPLKTFGTNANNSLSAFVVGTDDMTAAQVALLNLGIKNDLISGRPKINEPYLRSGTLWIPNRGYLYLRPGDYVCFDATTGWPSVFSADAIANGPYTHS